MLDPFLKLAFVAVPAQLLNSSAPSKPNVINVVLYWMRIFIGGLTNFLIHMI